MQEPDLHAAVQGVVCLPVVASPLEQTHAGQSLFWFEATHGVDVLRKPFLKAK